MEVPPRGRTVCFWNTPFRGGFSRTHGVKLPSFVPFNYLPPLSTTYLLGLRLPSGSCQGSANNETNVSWFLRRGTFSQMPTRSSQTLFIIAPLMGPKDHLRACLEIMRFCVCAYVSFLLAEKTLTNCFLFLLVKMNFCDHVFACLAH